ncbi:MAG: fluoride efflux transporter CrcB [Desulfovibrio sp.]
MHKLLFVIIGGAAGACSRYGLAAVSQRILDTSFPVGTFIVNILGCLLFGLLWGLFEDGLNISSELRLLFFTGFMGSFTTFSTYIFEGANLLKSGNYTHALFYMGGQILIGLICVVAGMAAGRAI